jgi:hypothetical protein
MKVLVKRKRFDTLPTVCGREDYGKTGGKADRGSRQGRWCGSMAEQQAGLDEVKSRAGAPAVWWAVGL